MTTYSKQETFDTVARHLLRQSAKSVFDYGNGETSCAYRGDNDSKPVSLWKDNMRSLANGHELDPSVLDEFEWDEDKQRYVEKVK